MMMRSLGVSIALIYPHCRGFWYYLVINRDIHRNEVRAFPLRSAGEFSSLDQAYLWRTRDQLQLAGPWHHGDGDTRVL